MKGFVLVIMHTDSMCPRLLCNWLLGSCTCRGRSVTCSFSLKGKKEKKICVNTARTINIHDSYLHGYF